MKYPRYVQAIFNTRLQIDPQQLVDSYYNSLALTGDKDTQENFKLFAYGYMDGHCRGFDKGVQKCTENGLPCQTEQKFINTETGSNFKQ